VLHETLERVNLFHVTLTFMKSATTIRVRKHREGLRAAGLRPVQIWLPDTRSKSFRKRCQRECLMLEADPNEAEVLDWIERVADLDGWRADER
jgi:hypothetical protein